MSDETMEQAPVVESETTEPPIDDTPKPVKRSKRKAAEVPLPSPTARAQAILGLPETGKVDHAFKAALRGYQRANNLAVNGRLDDPTRRSMGV